MGKWEMVKISELCSLVTDGTHQTPTYSENGYIFLSSKNVTTGKIDWEEIKYIPQELHNQLYKRLAPQKNDILLAKNGTTGICAKVDRDVIFDIYVSLALLRPKSIIESNYFVYAINNPYTKRKFDRHLKGIGVPNLHLSSIRETSIPLPPLDEQKRIAKNLDLASEIVKGYKEQLAELDKLVQSVFYEMFGESKTNPMQWQTKKLGEIGKVGSSKRVFTEELVESGIPFYRGTEIGALATKRDINIEYFITQEHYNELCKASGRPTIGDLLMPSICNDGRIWRVDNDEPFYFKDGRVLWVHFSEQSSDNVYIQFALRERLISDYNNIASGTTFAELKIFALKNVDIMLPPLPLQIRFASVVTEIETQKAQVQQALTEAENLFNSLMQEYFE